MIKRYISDSYQYSLLTLSGLFAMVREGEGSKNKQGRTLDQCAKKYITQW